MEEDHLPRMRIGLVALAIVACSAEETGKADTTIPIDLCPDGAVPPCEDTPIAPDTDTTTTPGPEDEDPVPLMGPAQSDRHLFITNPARDTLTRIDVFTYEVRTTPVGRDPTLALVTVDHTTAAVLNRGDDTVSLVATENLATRTVPVRDDLNRMVQSPDGQWLVLWHDETMVRADDPPPDHQQLVCHTGRRAKRAGNPYLASASRGRNADSPVESVVPAAPGRRRVESLVLHVPQSSRLKLPGGHGDDA